MGSEESRDLRARGIAAAKAGAKAEARELLQQAIRLEPDNEAAWLWLASVAASQRERVLCLQRLLEINPGNATARKALDALLKVPERPGEPPLPVHDVEPSTSDGPPAPVRRMQPINVMELEIDEEPAQEQPGQALRVPLPSAEHLARAMREAEAAAEQYMAETDPAPAIEWVHKTRGRAGERDILWLRLQIAAISFVILMLAGFGGLFLVMNNSEARALVMAPTATLTLTPTLTPTSTPGLTPTPSPTPAVTLTPSPTVPPGFPAYDPYSPPRPTEPYPRPETMQLRHAVALIGAGQAREALPTLDAERRLVQNLFNPVPYYYEAVAQALLGDGNQALQTLRDAEDQLTASNSVAFKPVIDAGYAVVYSHLAASAIHQGRAGEAEEYAAQAQERAQAAIQADERNVDAYLALASLQALAGNTALAMQTLDEALAVRELQTNARLLVRKGELYFEQGDYDQAMYQAFMALYMNPLIERAHQLRIRAALAKDQPGLGVVYAEEYAFYFPGSVAAYALLGDARRLEGNNEQALTAYTQALVTDEPTDGTEAALLGRAAIYRDQGRYDLAYDDLTRAYALNRDPATRAERMQVAYLAGRFDVVLEDTTALREYDVLPEAVLDLMQARALVDSAGSEDDSRRREALGLLAGVTNLSEEDLAAANEYTARAYYGLGNYNLGLNAITQALALGDTAERHYLRGLILEAQDDTEGAAREFEWVLMWSGVAPLDFRADAEARLRALRSPLTFAAAEEAE